MQEYAEAWAVADRGRYRRAAEGLALLEAAERHIVGTFLEGIPDPPRRARLELPDPTALFLAGLVLGLGSMFVHLTSEEGI